MRYFSQQQARNTGLRSTSEGWVSTYRLSQIRGRGKRGLGLNLQAVSKSGAAHRCEACPWEVSQNSGSVHVAKGNNLYDGIVAKIGLAHAIEAHGRYLAAAPQYRTGEIQSGAILTRFKLCRSAFSISFAVRPSSCPKVACAETRSSQPFSSATARAIFSCSFA